MIWERLIMKVEVLGGDADSFILEHRLLNLVLIIVIGMCSVGIIINCIAGLNIYTNAITAGGLLFFGYLYYLSRIQKHYKLSLAALIIGGSLFILPVWMFNGGTFSSIPYFMILAGSLFAILLNKAKRIAVVSGFIILANALVALEYYYPAAIMGYGNSLARCIDIGASLTMAMLVNAYLICILMHQYKKEQAKVKVCIDELENHKVRLEKQLYIEEMNIKLQKEIDERIKSEEARRASDKKFSCAFAASPVPMCIIALNSARYVEINTSAVETFGYTEEDFSNGAKMCRKIMHLKQYRAILKELKEHDTISKMETAFYNKDGVLLSGLLSIEKVNIEGAYFWLCVWYDLTQLRNMQMEVKRLDRFNVVSKMAVSLAHEIRNPMTTVRGFLQLAQYKNSMNSESAKIMIDEIDKANAIITQFLFMAKERMSNFQLKNINNIIYSVLPLVEKDVLKAGHSLDLRREETPLILVDENQIKEMLINIIRNGIEAMKDKGKLLINTYAQESTVILDISDEGPGIAPEVIQQIGTPFFTTKQDGKGLGLAVCYSIAARHGAQIKIRTGQKGTTFRIEFKAVC
jgi:PAS domain S-box-containing protein